MTTFFISQHKLVHATHGTFFVGRLFEADMWEADRVYSVPDQEKPVVEQVGKYSSLTTAKRAVRKRIAELDAQVVDATSSASEGL